MADLTLERPGSGDGDEGTSPAVAPKADGGLPDMPGPATPADPRAVRVAIGPASRLDGEPAMVVAPMPEPLAPVRHTLAGKGPLGGTVRDTAGSDEGDLHGAAVGRSVSSDGSLQTATEPAGGPTVLVDGEPLAVRLVRRDPRRAELVVGQGSGALRHRVVFADDAVTAPDGTTRREVVVDGWRIDVELEPERRAVLRERARRGREATVHGGPTEVHAIIPGRVVSVSVAPGDAVTAGQQILVVEAMKMQNELRAPRDGSILRVAVAPGVTIEVGDLLLVIE